MEGNSTLELKVRLARLLCMNLAAFDILLGGSALAAPSLALFRPRTGMGSTQTGKPQGAEGGIHPQASRGTGRPHLAGHRRGFRRFREVRAGLRPRLQPRGRPLFKSRGQGIGEGRGNVKDFDPNSLIFMSLTD
jgi:hypothetical protein